MREYTSPLIDDMDVSVEGVYAGSGSSPDIPDIPIIPPKDDPTPPRRRLYSRREGMDFPQQRKPLGRTAVCALYR